MAFVSPRYNVHHGEHADSWNRIIGGQVFLFIAHPSSTTVCRMEWAKFTPYSWIPGNTAKPKWDWRSVGSRHVEGVGRNVSH